MTIIKHSIVINQDGESVITLVSQGEVVTVDQTHPNFTRIAQAIVNEEDPSRFLSISQAISEMDERVVVLNDTVFFDGEPVDNALTRTILRYNREGRDTANLVKFLERLSENPSKRGRETIFEWIAGRDLTIDADGRFIGWKGVRPDMLSVNRGTAFVDGEKFEGNIPNEVGSVVSMPRTEVMDDPNQDCHVGLHVGTYEYAKGFGQVLLEVAVDPADVVSVPSSATGWKIRCCKYEVLRIHETESNSFEEDYEPESEWEDEGAEVLAPVVPESFLSRLRAKLSGSGN
jgi:hypothetical protein